VPIGDLSEATRKYKQLKARYPNMYVPTDFSFIENSWVNNVKVIGASPRPLVITHEAIDFEVTNVKVEEPKEAAKEENKEGKEGVPSPNEKAAPAPAPVVVESFSNSGKR
jgi:hypothetical protein